jgi:hypothetical protein
MSTPENKELRCKRIQQKDRYIKHQVKIAKSNGMEVKAGQEHRYAKHSATTCGNSNCVTCGNPRKFWKERTIQEKKFIQTETWDGAEP